MAETLKDQLYQALKKSIENRALEPGVVLLESRIALLFSTSRSPVRETLLRLCDEGLICRFNGRGYVVGIDSKNIIRREITLKEVQINGALSVNREKSWLDLVSKVEKDAVLSSMSGRWEVNELKMAKSLGVSRAVTQQILVRLQYLGLVDHEQYSGWYVVALNDDRLNALYDARVLLEPFMLEKSTNLIPSSKLRGFINSIDKVSAMYPHIEANTLDCLEQDLHDETIKYAGNDEIITMLGRTRPILLVSKHLLGKHVDLPKDDPFLEEHRMIFELMLDKKGKEAADYLKKHLKDSRIKVLERLKEYREKGTSYSVEYFRWLSDE